MNILCWLFGHAPPVYAKKGYELNLNRDKYKETVVLETLEEIKRLESLLAAEQKEMDGA